MVVALLTDFGLQDYFVGAMKGVILSINEHARIVDITHEIEPQKISSASFVLNSSFRNFPRKTVFVAVVDPGVGSNRRGIVVETDDYVFVAPDNGLLSFIFESGTSFRVFELSNSKFFLSNVSRTFHGRDVFAPVAGWLSKGIKPSELGTEVSDFVSFTDDKPKRIATGMIEAEIIHIDRFGNLITNLRKEDLPSHFFVEVNGTVVDKHLRYYAEADIDELFVIFGSAGYLEIVANQNSAKVVLNVKNKEKIVVKTT